MTIDDDNSIYVGGLPYDSTEDSLRRVFDLYGAVVAVKIINDRGVGGKCYGFVTFTNPRSAIDAISDMNGRDIGGRVVRVNEVRSRGGRLNSNRENFHRGVEKDIDWDKERDRGRDHGRDRDRHRVRYDDRSRERDRERDREYDQGHNHDRAQDKGYDQGQSHDRIRDRILDQHRYEQDQEQNQNNDRELDRNLNCDNDREFDKTRYHDRNKDNDKENQSENELRHLMDHRSGELSSNSSDKYCDQVREQLEISIQRREELQREIVQIEEKFDEKQHLVSDLQKKSQKMEATLASAKKISSLRHMQLAKLQRCFLQVKDCTERLKRSEQELQSLVDAAMVEAVDDEGTGVRDGACMQMELPKSV